MNTSTDDLKPFIDDLIHHVYCRIAPSKVHGVGVVAVRPIPKGTNVFQNLVSKTGSQKDIRVPQDRILKNDQIAEGVKQIICDFMTFHEGYIDLPSEGLNQLNISFYLNHSDVPNIQTPDGETFITTRDIETGEELFSDYHTYSEEPLPYGTK